MAGAGSIRMSDKVLNVIDGITSIICFELQAFSSEYWQPRLAADQMDAELKFRKTRIVELRRIREETENLLFGLDRDAL